MIADFPHMQFSGLLEQRTGAARRGGCGADVSSDQPGFFSSAANPGAPSQAFLRVPADKISKLIDLVGELSLSVSETIRSPDLDASISPISRSRRNR